MTLPKRIKIGWKEYEIRKLSSVLNSGNELYGQIDYDEQTITLRANNGCDQDACTLIHEVLHGISNMYCLALDEALVEKLANAIFTVMKDNHYLSDRSEQVPPVRQRDVVGVGSLEMSITAT